MASAASNMAGYFAAAPEQDPAADPNHSHWDTDVGAPGVNGAERVRATVDLGVSAYQADNDG